MVNFSSIQIFTNSPCLEETGELRDIEEELLDMDEADTVTSRNLFTRHRDVREASKRSEHFARAEKTYKEYAELVAAAKDMNSLSDVPASQWRTVERFVSSAKPVVKRESEWIEERNDLITLQTTGYPFILSILESGINKGKQHLQKTNWTGQSWLASNASSEVAAYYLNTVSVGVLLPLLVMITIYGLTVVGGNVLHGIGLVISSEAAFVVLL